MKHSVSIIICTRDRADSLRFTIASISEAAVPADCELELLIVDNGSKDATKSVSEEANLSNMEVRYLSEPRKGKGYAYNSGIAAARGQVYLFTDDDVRVPRDWIEEMARPLLNGTAEAVQGGVKIAPHLERSWLTGVLRIWVASVEDPIRAPEGLVGANMAFGRLAVEIAGGFDPRLGPGASGFFDDTVFGWALVRAGKTILYKPTIAVEHHFTADRLTLRSYINSAQKMATSRAIVNRDIDPSAPSPSIFALLKQVPGLGYRCMTQTAKFLINRRPDAGFIARYYAFCLWRATRARDPNNK